jgi:cation diffusion facilitator family transporter
MFDSKAPRGADHRHDSHPGHGSHSHGPAISDPALTTTTRGIWAIKWSFVGLLATALLQAAVVVMSGSVALLADTIHNVGDAVTAFPLWIAFLMVRLKPNKQFSFGYGRVEDLAGVAIVLTILFSAIVAGYEAIDRLIHPQQVQYLWAVVAASVTGFLGNEIVAVFRIKVGREIGSAALIADGYHARVDGWTSLAVLFGALGVWMGYPLADPLVGLGITLAILWIVFESAKTVFTRMLDGVEPGVIDHLRAAARGVPGVLGVTEVRARWLGHRLKAEVNIAVDPRLSVAEGHSIAKEVHQQLMNELRYLSGATIHVDPVEESGEEYHNSVPARHGQPTHSH